MLCKNPEMSPELTRKERTSYCHAEVPVGVPCNYSTGPKDASHNAASGSRFLEAFASDSNVDAPAKSLSLQLLDTQGTISEARFYHVPWQKVSGIARSIAQECPLKPVWCPMTHWEENMEDVSRFGTQPSRLDSLKMCPGDMMIPPRIIWKNYEKLSSSIPALVVWWWKNHFKSWWL